MTSVFHSVVLFFFLVFPPLIHSLLSLFLHLIIHVPVYHTVMCLFHLEKRLQGEIHSVNHVKGELDLFLAVPFAELGLLGESNREVHLGHYAGRVF